ncbi:hypothetical protein [Microbacterium sp.]|uniref:hypothetical protein n=1 Tax=Microbacterium sp. TaxID=51671 RepID=UPI002C18D73C|nr:hypothetical protein [Microbacterium sp.]HWL79248.1 hypothetical protein [Microbacterium sp.]
MTPGGLQRKVNLSPRAVEKLSDEIGLYSDRLIAEAEVIAITDPDATVVDGHHITSAARRLRPKTDDGGKTLLDWCKQGGLLLLGIAIPLIVQFVATLRISDSPEPDVFDVGLLAWGLGLGLPGLILTAMAAQTDLSAWWAGRAAKKLRG